MVTKPKPQGRAGRRAAVADPERTQRAKALEVLVERFQCALGFGCFHGRDTRCGSYAPEAFEGGGACIRQAPALNAARGQPDAAGMPAPFKKLGPAPHFEPGREQGAFAVVLWSSGHRPTYGRDAVPVWAMEGEGRHAGFLFVRVVEPLLGRIRVDVIEGGRLTDAPGALDVSQLDETELRI